MVFTHQGVGRRIPQLARPDGRGVSVRRPAKEGTGVPRGSARWLPVGSSSKKGAGGVVFALLSPADVCVLPPVFTHSFLLSSGCLSVWQTLPGNGPTVTTLPAVRLSSKTPLIPAHTSELKLALEGTGSFTPSQVMTLEDNMLLSLHFNYFIFFKLV